MDAPASHLWYDLETSGTDPAADRIIQFAAIRTDADLNPVGEPVEALVALDEDVVPSLGATLVHRLSPAKLRESGIPEWEAISQIKALIAHERQTCLSGFNNLAFDDQFLRHTLFRCLHDPYEHEWLDGNSRFDLIDVARAYRALRPEGINWPVDGEGRPSMRLTDLTAANGIEHGLAHDALADVRATYALAAKLKAANPNLWKYALDRRDKAHSLDLLGGLGEGRMAVHISRRYGPEGLQTAPVAPVFNHPAFNGRVIVANLLHPPEALDALLSGVDDDGLRQSVSGPLEDGQPRLLVEVVGNKCPFLAPAGSADFERLGWDRNVVAANLAAWTKLADLGASESSLIARAVRAFLPDDVRPDDAELALYGEFIPRDDKPMMATLRNASLNPSLPWPKRANLVDGRLSELAERLRCRARPDTLSEAERAEWLQWVVKRRREGVGRRGGTEALTVAINGLSEEERASMDEGALALVRELAFEAARPVELPGGERAETADEAGPRAPEAPASETAPNPVNGEGGQLDMGF